MKTSRTAKNKPKKYPFGGAVDEYNVLLNSFKNSDQSTWMSKLNEYGARGGYNMNTTPEGLTQQGLDKMFAGYEAGVPKYMEQFKNENYNRIYEDHWNNASWWDQQFGRKKLKNEAVGLTEQQAQQSIGYDGNIRGNIQNQMGGIEGLMGLFGTFQNFMNPAQGDTFNPAQWFVNPTRGYQYGGNVLKPTVSSKEELPKSRKPTKEEAKRMAQMELVLQLLDPTGISSYPELTSFNDPKAGWDDKTLAVISALPAIGKLAKLFGKGSNLVRVGTEVEQHRRSTDYKFGGDVSQKGYSEGSPYTNMPSIGIPGNKIDMTKTNVPLLLIPDKGEPKIAPPNSGIHKFKGAKQVLEVPFMQYGGDNKYEIGGEINAPLEDQAPVPIQTEKGEVAAMPDGGIVDVKAKKKHKNMDDEEVTDILPPGSFVASDHKRMQFTKEDVEDTVFGFNPIEYNEEGATEAPKEYTAADIMTKKKMTPAEYLNVVKSRFKQTDREDDAFAQRAAEENLESRQPYIDAMINLTERKSPDSKTPKQAKYGYYIPNVQMQQIPKGMTEQDMSGLMGMGFQNGGKVGKYPFGAIVQGIATIASSIMQSNAAKRQRNDLIANYGDTISILDKAKGVQTNNLGLGTLAGAAGIMGQNPNVDAPVLDTRYVDALPQEMPRYMTDYAAQQINQASAPYINFAQRNAPSFNRGLNSLQGMQANQFNALSKLAVQRAQENVGLRTNYLNQRGQLANQQITMNTDAVNKTRANRNVQIQNMGALGSNYFTGLNNIEANDAGNRITAGNVKATGQAQALQNLANANSMIPFAIAQAYNGTDWSKIFQNNNTQNTQSQIQAPYIGTSFNNNGAGLYSNNLGKKWDPWASFGGG